MKFRLITAMVEGFVESWRFALRLVRGLGRALIAFAHEGQGTGGTHRVKPVGP